MEKFELVKPSIEDEKQAVEYIEEHIKYQSPVNGVGGLDKYLTHYGDWIEKLEKDRKQEISSETVPAETFFLVRKSDNKIVGMVNIRLALNEKLRNSVGNIGYSIRPTERRKGYNKINLYLALLECKKQEIKQVMLNCTKTNLGSAKTIQALNGKLEREYYDEKHQCIQQVYWIDVGQAIKEKKAEFEKYIVDKKE